MDECVFAAVRHLLQDARFVRSCVTVIVAFPYVANCRAG